MNNPKNQGRMANKIRPVIKAPHQIMTPGF
jgi:hypothetical protein